MCPNTLPILPYAISWPRFLPRYLERLVAGQIGAVELCPRAVTVKEVGAQVREVAGVAV